MYPLNKGMIVGLLLSVSCAVVCAQEDPPTDGSVDQYLNQLGLTALRSRHLEDRIEELEGEARGLAAVRLATLLGEMLEAEKSPDVRREIEQRSRALLRLVPPDEADDLKLTIAKARYFQTERDGQASLLAESEPAEDEVLAREFQALLPDLREIATQADREIRRIEIRLRASNADLDEAVVRQELDDLRSRRSQAYYYLGWSQVELARLTGQSRYANQAVRDFGWLLGSPNDREPSVENISAGLLSYAHVARAAIGCARAAALRGDDVGATRWLDLVIAARDSLSPEVQSQLLSQQILILSGAKRWADLQVALERGRRNEDGSTRLLSPLEARLLAVSTLSAMSEDMRGPVGDARRSLLEALSQIGLSDLVSHGELGQVLAVVTRFGTLPIGEEGFIVQYVRAVRAADRAEAAQVAAGETLGSPTVLDSVANRYIEAAHLFQQAIGTSDAQKFASERAEAGLFQGRALYAAGQFLAAADAFEAAAADPQVAVGLAEEALWNAIVALEKVTTSGEQSFNDRRDMVASVFLERFPASSRSAELLIRRIEGGLLPVDEAIEILLAVPEGSALRDSARLMASGMLFEQYRRLRGPEKSRSADRFLRVAAGLIAQPMPEDAKRANIYQLLSRQILDASFAVEPADIALATTALELLEQWASKHSSDDSLRGEMLYRQLQLAIARSDPTAIEHSFEALTRHGGEHVGFAEGLMYERAWAAWIRDNQDIDAARDVVRYGQRLLSGRFRDNPAAQARVIASSVVRAAWAVHTNAPEAVFRDLAMALGERLRDANEASVEVLMIHAQIAEEVQQLENAIISWRLILASLEPGSPQWISARLDSLRLLASIDQERAREVLTQFDVLHGSGLTLQQREQRDLIARRLNTPAVDESARSNNTESQSKPAMPTGGGA
jgi:hypothetical protein